MTLLLSLLGLAALILVASVIHFFNRFVKLRALCDEAFAGIDVQLKRRWDLIPKLMAVVKGASKFESDTLQQVTAARTQAQAARSLPEREKAEQALGSALGGFFAVAEAYPDLKAVQGYLELQKQIAAVEDELQYSRRYYNACVRDNNTYGQSFPALLLAPSVGFKLRDYFMLEGAEREAPALA